MVRQLIRYAGFDPDEDNFTGIELKPLFPVGSLPNKDRIDEQHALLLFEGGMTAKEIGEMMAKRCGRKMAYTADAIQQCITRARKNV